MLDKLSSLEQKWCGTFTMDVGILVYIERQLKPRRSLVGQEIMEEVLGILDTGKRRRQLMMTKKGGDSVGRSANTGNDGSARVAKFENFGEQRISESCDCWDRQ